MKIKTASYITLMTLTGIMLSACGGGGGTSSDDVVPASALVNENIPMMAETIMGRVSSFNATITASAAAETQLTGVGNSQLKPLVIQSVSLPKAGGQYMHPYAPEGVGPGKACWDGAHGATLSQGQSCQVSFTVESDQPQNINGDLAIHLQDADRSELDLSIHTSFITSEMAKNKISLLNTPYFLSGQSAEFAVQNNNNEALKNVALDFSNMPKELYDVIDFSHVPALQYDAQAKKVYVTNPYSAAAIMNPQEQARVSVMIKDDEASRAVLKKYYADLVNNSYEGKALITIEADNAQDLRPETLKFDLIPVTLSNVSVDSPGQTAQQFINNADSSYVIDSVAANDLPDDVTLSQAGANVCKSGLMIPAHGSCDVLYQVGANAHTKGNTPESKPVVITYQSTSTQSKNSPHDDQAMLRLQADHVKQYTTAMQLSPQQMNVAGVPVSFVDTNLLVKAGTQAAPEVTNIALKNTGGFNWQLPSNLDAFMIHRVGDDQSVAGLTVVEPTGGVLSCGSWTSVEANGLCYIGIQSNSEATDKNTQYVITVKKNNNIASAISQNFSITNGQVTAVVDDNNNGDIGVKSIVISNAASDERKLTALLNDDQAYFEVYQEGASQHWCTTATCPDSCFDGSAHFASGVKNTITLAGQKSCQIYFKAKPLAMGQTHEATLDITGLGEIGKNTSIFDLAANEYVFAAMENGLYGYHGASWQTLNSGQNLYDLELNSKGSPMISYQYTTGDIGTENYKVYQGTEKLVNTKGQLFINHQHDDVKDFVSVGDQVFKTKAFHDKTGWYIERVGQYTKNTYIYVPGSYNEYTTRNFNLVVGNDNSLYLVAYISSVGDHAEYQLFKLILTNDSYHWQPQGGVLQLSNQNIGKLIQGQNGVFYVSTYGFNTGDIYQLNNTNSWQSLASFTQEDGIGTNIFAMNVDAKGQLYIVAATSTTNLGKFYLYRYDSNAHTFSTAGDFVLASMATRPYGYNRTFNINFDVNDQVYVSFYGDSTSMNDGSGFAVYNPTSNTWMKTLGLPNQGSWIKTALSAELTIEKV
ncbi:hypothetical protein [Cysteiniphilum litorale]|uniref:hypothetical protein n=1 Tax=Cysteiniphilum litorale TaxID=2056700 RepID=UPI003F88254F